MSTSAQAELLGGPWQICFVVGDLEGALRTWVDVYGVGPWSIWNLGPERMVDLAIDELPAEYGMRIAITSWGPMEIELIQPLDDRSIYAQSLRSNDGKPHVHHLHCTAADYDSALAEFRGRGHRALMSGGFRGARFSYLSTAEELGTILEVGHHPQEWSFPAPDATYPEPSAPTEQPSHVTDNNDKGMPDA